MHQIHLQTGDLTLPSFLNRLVSEIPLLPLHSTPQPLLPLENFLLAPRRRMCRHPSLGAMQHLTKLDVGGV